MDMRQDIAEMKQIMVQILGVNPAVFNSNASNYPAKTNPFASNTNNDLAIQNNPNINPYENPNLLIKPHNAIYNAHLHNHKAINDDYATEFVEDSLSIEDKERELIVRALSKHKNRRRRCRRFGHIGTNTIPKNKRIQYKRINMAWIYLFGASIMEICWMYSLKFISKDRL